MWTCLSCPRASESLSCNVCMLWHERAVMWCRSNQVKKQLQSLLAEAFITTLGALSGTQLGNSGNAHIDRRSCFWSECMFLCRIASYSPLLYSEVNLCFVCWFRYELDLSLLADDTDESHILDADSVLLIDRVCWRYWAALIGQLWTILMADPMTICSGCAMAATTRWCSMDA